jgi:fused signal recognition particle receptor
MTKLDGTAKGGTLLAISHELKLPILYITNGEGVDNIKEFDEIEYVDNILNSEINNLNNIENEE